MPVVRSPRPRRVVFSTTVAGSMESFVNPIARKLAEAGDVVTLISGDRPVEADFEHNSVVIPMARTIAIRHDAASLREWVRFLRSYKPDAIVAGTPKASLLSLSAARLARVPTRIYVIHGAVWDTATGSRRKVLEGCERLTLASATSKLAVSSSLADLIMKRNLTTRHPDVLGRGSFCGVDTRHFKPETTPTDSSNLCFVGRLNQDKGVDALLRIFDRIRNSVDATLTLVGRLDDSAPADEASVSRIKNDPNINWVGEVTDVRPYLQKADLLLLPTAREGLPQVALEAQACGVPVLSWRVTGVVDAVEDGRTGRLLNFGDEEAFANTAIELMQKTDSRAQMGRNAREFVVNEFDQQIVAERTAAFIRSRINGDST